MAVIDMAVIDAIKDISTFTGNTVDVANITIYLQNDSNTQFSASCQKEVIGLLKKGIFKIIKLYNILKGTRLFNSQFINKIKNKGTNKAFKKLRLVIQAYNNSEKELVLT